jgi:hypothetical protein
MKLKKFLKSKLEKEFIFLPSIKEWSNAKTLHIKRELPPAEAIYIENHYVMVHGDNITIYKGV